MLYFRLLFKKLSRKEVEIESSEVDKILGEIREQVVADFSDLYSFFIPYYLFPADFMSNVKKQIATRLGQRARMRDLIIVAEGIIYDDTVELMIKLNHGVMPELARV
jgi:hypothetical protein